MAISSSHHAVEQVAARAGQNRDVGQGDLVQVVLGEAVVLHSEQHGLITEVDRAEILDGVVVNRRRGLVDVEDNLGLTLGVLDEREAGQVVGAGLELLVLAVGRERATTGNGDEERQNDDLARGKRCALVLASACPSLSRSCSSIDRL